MKILDTLWGLALTGIVFAIVYTFFYQVATDEDFKQSAFFATGITLVVRFLMAKLLQNVEADFNWIRELIGVIIGITITYFIHGQY